MKLPNLLFIALVFVMVVSPARSAYGQAEEEIVFQTGIPCFYNSDESIVVELTGLNETWPVGEWSDRFVGGQKEFRTRIRLKVSGGAKIEIAEDGWSPDENDDTVWWLTEERGIGGALFIEITDLEGLSQIIIEGEYQQREREADCIIFCGAYGSWSDWTPQEIETKEIELCKVVINPVLPSRSMR